MFQNLPNLRSDPQAVSLWHEKSSKASFCLAQESWWFRPRFSRFRLTPKRDFVFGLKQTFRIQGYFRTGTLGCRDVSGDTKWYRVILLTMLGRIIGLIRAAMSNIPINYLSIFKIPKQISGLWTSCNGTSFEMGAQILDLVSG